MWVGLTQLLEGLNRIKLLSKEEFSLSAWLSLGGTSVTSCRLSQTQTKTYMIWFTGFQIQTKTIPLFLLSPQFADSKLLSLIIAIASSS